MQAYIFISLKFFLLGINHTVQLSIYPLCGNPCILSFHILLKPLYLASLDMCIFLF